MSGILNYPAPVESVITQLRFVSQLIKDIPRVLQTLLKYFNGAVISTFFLLLPAGVLPVVLILNLTDLECFMLLYGTYLCYCHKLPDSFV